jgi:hypothetical protein
MSCSSIYQASDESELMSSDEEETNLGSRERRPPLSLRPSSALLLARLVSLLQQPNLSLLNHLQHPSHHSLSSSSSPNPHVRLAREPTLQVSSFAVVAL